MITRLDGGLGNQLFQYAAGLALAEKLAAPLKIDLTALARDPLRRFELANFRISAAVASPEEIGAFVTRPSRAQRAWGRLAVALGIGDHRVAFREYRYGYNRLFAAIRRPVYLSGYWQSERYFSAIADQLRAELTPVAGLSPASRQVLAEIESCPAISIHIRRGDYLTNPAAAALLGLCPLEYYAAAVARLAAQVADPCFFVFSDDPQWARDNLKIDYPVRFVEANGPERGVEDMWLMKSSRHHIIANSSFSWWAAWLNDRPDKIVIAPRRWFSDPRRNRDTADLIPPVWQRL